MHRCINPSRNTENDDTQIVPFINLVVKRPQISRIFHPLAHYIFSTKLEKWQTKQTRVNALVTPTTNKYRQAFEHFHRFQRQRDPRYLYLVSDSAREGTIAWKFEIQINTGTRSSLTLQRSTLPVHYHTRAHSNSFRYAHTRSYAYTRTQRDNTDFPLPCTRMTPSRRLLVSRLAGETREPVQGRGFQRGRTSMRARDRSPSIFTINSPR